MPAADMAFRQQIVRHCPDLTIERMEPLPHWGWGGDSDAWLVNGALIFRFPRSPDIAQHLRVEACLLPQLAPLLPLAIPDFCYVASDPATQLPRFVGYPAIPGEPMTPALLDALAMPEAERLALADYVKTVHDPNPGLDTVLWISLAHNHFGYLPEQASHRVHLSQASRHLQGPCDPPHVRGKRGRGRGNPERDTGLSRPCKRRDNFSVPGSTALVGKYARRRTGSIARIGRVITALLLLA